MLGFHGAAVLQTNRLSQTKISGMVLDTMDMLRVMKIMVMLLLDRIPTCMAVIRGIQVTNHLSNSSK